MPRSTADQLSNTCMDELKAQPGVWYGRCAAASAYDGRHRSLQDIHALSHVWPVGDVKLCGAPELYSSVFSASQYRLKI